MSKYSTKQREALLSFFEKHADEAMTVSEIAEALRPELSQSAVYRNLAELEEEGKVHRSTRTGSRSAYYQYMGAESCEGELHLSCKKCGKTVHIDKETTEQLTKQIKTKERFSLDSSDTVLYGVCESCQKKDR